MDKSEDDDDEWRPKNGLQKEMKEKKLRTLAAKIGINFVPKREPVPIRPRRKRSKPAQYAPVEKLRSWKVEDLRSKSSPSHLTKTISSKSTTGNRKRKNVFGGENVKKQRSLFKERALKVYTSHWMSIKVCVSSCAFLHDYF